MKTVLIIAPSSYPLYGAESIVNLKLLTVLSRSGEFAIDLISKKNKHSEYVGNTLEEMGISVSSIHVVEVDNKVNVKTIWGHILSFLSFGVAFKGSHWAYYSMKIAVKLCKQKRYDYVLTKNSPSLLIGYYLKKKYGIKWVATWNDPYPDFLYPEIYAKYIHAQEDWSSRKQLGIIRNYVDIHVFPNNRLRDYLLRYYKIDISRTIVIPHVVIDNKNKRPNTDKSLLRIVHSGNIAYPRDPEPFLAALRQVLDNNPQSSIKVDVIGVMDARFNDKVRKYKLEGIVNGMPPLSYLDSLAKLSEYHVCLIVEANVPEGIFLPTKVSDFMQEQMPIMAVSPQEGVLHDLFINGNIGYFANVCDINEIAHAIEKLFVDFKNDTIVASNIPYNYTEDFVIKSYLNL